MNFAALRASTIPGLLVERVLTRPARVAFRSKELGIWRETTWRGLADRVAALALGFAREYRFARGETVAIIGNPCPEWTVADLAAQTLGAITYGIYPTSAPGEVRHLLQHGGATLVVVEDQEHLDKTLEVLDACPGVRGVLVVDTRALFMYRNPRVRPLADIETIGRTALAAEPHALDRLVRSLSPDDPATIIYTSGTTGHPKGAVYRHGPHLAACANIIEHYPILQTGEHRAVAMLPLCHAMGRNLAITMPLLADIVPHYPESVDTFADALYEIQPTFVFTVPRYLQKFAAHLLVGLDQSSRVKRAAYRLAMTAGRQALEHRHDTPGARGSAALAAVANALVFRWLLEKVGFARARLVLSSGAPLPPAVARLWQAWGVNVCEAYGQTETGGALVSGQRGPYPQPGDVGTIAPNLAVELDDDGEIMVSGELFAGYWRDPDATRALYRDGKLATGDVGEWTDGRALRLVDRKKDILITAGGKNVSPSHVENRLRASPYISEAAVFGEGRKYLVALLEADGETVGEWAREHGVVHTGYASLVTRPEVVALIEAEVRRANDDLTRVEQVKAFRLLPRELDPELEDEPVTPTRKVKRRLMAERYSPLVASMYAGDEEHRIAAEMDRLER
jgi:long-chain acyl-CoA synthetase